MTLMISQQSKSQSRLPRLSAHLVAVTLLFGGAHAVWGQDAGESRWSTSNPPTPAMVHMPQKPQDSGLRRLPPIDQEVQPGPKPSSFAATEKPAPEPQIAAIPQSSPAAEQKADPVNWSSPNVVIGPETAARTVSHEEVVATSKPPIKGSRYSSTPEITSAAAPPKGQSRFTQAAPATPKPEVAPIASPPAVEKPAESKPAAPVFARVFDEQVESPGISQPEVATSDSGLSPIFACRLLGLRATKSESTTTR